MASYHLSQKIGYAGKSAPHAAYISRLGDYAPGGSKGKDLEDLDATGSGNMPAWAAANPANFWLAADLGEVATGASTRALLNDQGKPLRGDDGKILKILQKNRGQAYKEIEVALPRELNAAQRLALVHEFIDQEIGSQHAYTFAIHRPKAKLEGGDQPHLHLMYSERLIDEIDRDPNQYFRRYRPKNRAAGGCEKASSRRTAQQNKDALKLRRERWAVLQNAHLQAAGFTHRVDHRSNNARGILEMPERHLGPRAFDRQREEVLAERQMKTQRRDAVQAAAAELASAQAELRELLAVAKAKVRLEHLRAQAQAQEQAAHEDKLMVAAQWQAAEDQAAADAEDQAIDEEEKDDVWQEEGDLSPEDGWDDEDDEAFDDERDESAGPAPGM